MSSNTAELHIKTVTRPTGDSMGNGLFATADIENGGEVLRTDKPFVIVLDTPRLHDTCAGCYGTRQLLNPETASADLKACTRCKVVRYCNKSCQLKDWRFAHSLECPIFSKLYPNIMPNHARAVLRVILRHRSKKYSDDEFQRFLALGSHRQDMLTGSHKDRWENNILLSAKAVKEFSGVELSEEQIALYIARLDINAFNLATPFYDRIGLFLHPYAALINHSCDYNAVVSYEADKIFIKASRPIKKDEQIYVSYIDTTYSVNTRRKELAERYFFNCNCPKCTEEEKTPVGERASIEHAENKTKELIESASKLEDYDEAVKKYEQGIRTLLSTFACPITKQPYVSLRDELILVLLSARRFEEALVHTMIRYLRVDPFVYPNENSPVRRLHAWTLAKLGVYVSEESGPGRPDGPFRKFGINTALITWAALVWLVRGEREACTSPGFQTVVKEQYQQVSRLFISAGFKADQMASLFDEEWKKVDALAEHVLKQEREKGNAAITM
ncbi:hypothetical protein BGW36DRAFT_425922 [Talaromyces proteolyticus]|uniref:Suppressor of anucleate metulae protein B n=1 Tax=Talaromyces proteolyticus TaxID=1131652 RepID=A0AAD4KUH8_9EURO|nr:uncharacterized protein BGW36DRAFT_425922 [Talaromyces proteolyticus]KAH8701127.1 hypothetical protein BGW36DRAFT_425922 [Talaromyces proteolyticus]